MFDPAEVGSKLAPGDKVSMSFHKAKAEAPAGGSFVQRAQAAGMIPGGAPAAAAPIPVPHMPQVAAVSHPAVMNGRAMLLARLRNHLGIR
jgi:hypothetical protein